MSIIDKRALREAAEKAKHSSEWDIQRIFIEALEPDDVLALLDELEPMALAHLNLNHLCEVYRAAYEEARHDGLVNWEAAASLAEENSGLKRKLEAKDKSISFLKDQLAQLANFNPDWDKLEAATDSLREHMAELTAARARIAELEAREVKLPQRYSMLHRADFDEPYHTVFVYKQHQVIEVLQAAGIRINGEV